MLKKINDFHVLVFITALYLVIGIALLVSGQDGSYDYYFGIACLVLSLASGLLILLVLKSKEFMAVIIRRKP